jgi:hypothetical protein
MGGVDHKSADQFMADLALYLGGSVAEQKVEHGLTHTHTHSHGETGHRHTH